MLMNLSIEITYMMLRPGHTALDGLITAKTRPKTYESLVDVVVCAGNFGVNLGLAVLCTGYGRRRLFHC